MFGSKPKKTRTQLMAGDHPENDLSEFCDQDQIKQYQTIVRELIWLSGLGRFDIAVHIMTMSRFRQQPRIGHLENLKKTIGYLENFPHGSLRFRLHEPDYSPYHIENMTGRGLFMKVQRKKSCLTSQNQKENM